MIFLLTSIWVVGETIKLKESTPSVNPGRGARFCQVTFALPEWS